MSEEKTNEKDCCENKCCEGKNYHRQSTASGGAVYGLGIIGSAIFFISQATTFWMGALGLLKAIVWPAILVYHALKALGVS